MLNQGMRPDEVLSLAKTDVDLERKQLHIRAGKSPAARRTLDLTAESCSILGRRIEKGISPWIFPSHVDPKKGVPPKHVPRLNSAHDRLCEASKKVAPETEESKIAFVLYDLRHTFATRMAQAGVDLATLAAILGHNSLRIVTKYVHPTSEHKRDAMKRYDAVLHMEAEIAPGQRPN
jgi:integrase